MMTSPRLIAAGALRRLALDTAAPMERSRALLAELAQLLASYQRRALIATGEGDERRIEEQVQRVGPAELAAWWTVHSGELLDHHRSLARAQLATVGIA